MTTIKNIFSNFKRYHFLLQQLVIRDFKKKYKRSALGVLWSILYPLLMMVVMYMVFSQMVRFSIPDVNYFAYFQVGFVIFNYFSEASTSAMVSLINNFVLMRKVYIPKYVFPLSQLLFMGTNFLFTLIPLAGVIILTGTIKHISMWYFLIPVILLFGFMFTLGFSLIISALSVFFRDILYIYRIVLTIWNYVTPVFYHISLIPERFQPLFKLNPLYAYINSVRDIILFGRCPETQDLVLVVGYGIFVLIAGAIVFRKTQDQFIYYA